MPRATHVLLLRGVMPIGKNRVPVAKFRVILEELGFESVRTYIQTGNAVFATRMPVERIEAYVEKALKKKLGAEIKAFALKVSELKAIVRKAPFEKFDPQRHYFTILSESPRGEFLAWFRQMDFSPDRFVLKGRVLYAEYDALISQSKYNNNYFERKLSLSATTRNSNTMTKLLELAERG